MLVKSMIRQFLLVPPIIMFRRKDMRAFENSVELEKNLFKIVKQTSSSL